MVVVGHGYVGVVGLWWIWGLYVYISIRAVKNRIFFDIIFFGVRLGIGVLHRFHKEILDTKY